jgi:hypothetical protein
VCLHFSYVGTALRAFAHPTLATIAAIQRARPPKGFEAQSRKGSQGPRARLKSVATVKSFSSAAHPNSFWHDRAIKKTSRDIRRCRCTKATRNRREDRDSRDHGSDRACLASSRRHNVCYGSRSQRRLRRHTSWLVFFPVNPCSEGTTLVLCNQRFGRP